MASRARSQPRAPRTDATNALELAVARRQAWNAGNRRHPELPTTLADAASAFETAADGGLAPVAAEKSDQLIREALAARGDRYRWGGASRGGFDCSGFTRYLFARHAGVTLPHSASAQARLGQKVAREALRPGDLLFFRTYRRGISHVGLYIGGNQFVHAANTRRRVRVDSLNEAYYHNRFVTARRLKEPLAKLPWQPPPLDTGLAPKSSKDDDPKLGEE
jgi:cell wall-associated NlpC family hydrolase